MQTKKIKAQDLTVLVNVGTVRHCLCLRIVAIHRHHIGVQGKVRFRYGLQLCYKWERILEMKEMHECNAAVHQLCLQLHHLQVLGEQGMQHMLWNCVRGDRCR